jgi:hypothetical protein
MLATSPVMNQPSPSSALLQPQPHRRFAGEGPVARLRRVVGTDWHISVIVQPCWMRTPCSASKVPNKMRGQAEPSIGTHCTVSNRWPLARRCCNRPSHVVG